MEITNYTEDMETEDIFYDSENIYLHDLDDMYKDNIFVKDDIDIYEILNKYHKNNINQQAVQVKELLINIICYRIGKIIEYRIENLIYKDEYEDEIIELKEIDEDKYNKYTYYIRDTIECKTDELAKMILIEVITNKEDSGQEVSQNIYETMMIKSINSANEIIEKIKERANWNKKIEQVVSIKIFGGILLYIYQYGIKNIDYNFNLKSYRNKILQLNIADEKLIKRCLTEFNKRIQGCFDKGRARELEINLPFFVNKNSYIVMHNIIETCQKGKFEAKDRRYVFQVKKESDLKIVVDLKDYDGNDFKIKDIHKKIYIYILNLVYEANRQTIVKFNYKKFLEIVDKDKQFKGKCKELIKQLECVYLEVKGEKYRLIEIRGEDEKDNLKILGEEKKDDLEILGESKKGDLEILVDPYFLEDSKLAVIGRNAFVLEENKSAKLVGGEFSLILELCMHMFLYNESYDKEGYFKLKVRDIIYKLLAYKYNTKLKSKNIITASEIIYNLHESINNIDGWNTKLNTDAEKGYYGYIMFKNWNLLVSGAE